MFFDFWLWLCCSFVSIFAVLGLCLGYVTKIQDKKTICIQCKFLKTECQKPKAPFYFAVKHLNRNTEPETKRTWQELLKASVYRSGPVNRWPPQIIRTLLNFKVKNIYRHESLFCFFVFWHQNLHLVIHILQDNKNPIYILPSV